MGECWKHISSHAATNKPTLLQSCKARRNTHLALTFMAPIELRNMKQKYERRRDKQTHKHKHTSDHTVGQTTKGSCCSIQKTYGE
jgi:hypothetical protein